MTLIERIAKTLCTENSDHDTYCTADYCFACDDQQNCPYYKQASNIIKKQETANNRLLNSIYETLFDYYCNPNFICDMSIVDTYLDEERQEILFAVGDTEFVLTLTERPYRD